MLGGCIYKCHDSIPLANDNSILGYQSSSPAILQFVHISKIPMGHATLPRTGPPPFSTFQGAQDRWGGCPCTPTTKGWGRDLRERKADARWSGSGRCCRKSRPHVGSLPQSRCNAHVPEKKALLASLLQMHSRTSRVAPSTFPSTGTCKAPQRPASLYSPPGVPVCSALYLLLSIHNTKTSQSIQMKVHTTK